MNIGAPELLILAVPALLVGLVVLLTRGQQPKAPPVPVGPAGPIVVNRPPEEVLARVVQLLTANGALVTAQSPTSVSGHVTTKRKPSVLVAVLLWFICVVPMIIYLINGSKDVQEPFSLSLTPVPGGTRVDGGGMGRGESAVRWVLGQLREPGSVPSATPEGNPALPVAASAASNVTTAVPPGWYPDPDGTGSLRWWDGAAWTDHRHVS